MVRILRYKYRVHRYDITKIIKKGNILILLLLLLSLFLITFTSCTKQISKDDPRYCTAKEDCLPAACCHPDSSVNKANAPDCSEIICTMECRPNTLDCGQGRIDCVNNGCEAVINN